MPSISIQSLLGWYNVRDYGAKGSGYGNDGPAINQAIGAASAAGGGVVYIPAGTYRITTTVNLASSVELRGDGDVSVLKLGSATGLVKGVSIANFAVRDLKLDANRSVVTSGSTIALWLDTCTDARLVGLLITSGRSAAYYADDCDRIVAERCTFTDSAQSGASLNDCQWCQLVGCLAYDNGKTGDSSAAGVLIGGASLDNVIAGLVAYDSAAAGSKSQTYAIYETGTTCDRTVIVGGALTGNSTGTVRLTGGASRVEEGGGDVITGGAAISAKRLVATNRQTAGVKSVLVIGVAPRAIANAGQEVVYTSGLRKVVADAPLTVGDPIAVGVAGRATKHTTAQFDIQTAIAGESTAFTQPVAATTLEILQAADVAADRGRGIVIEGANGSGVAITETILLDATNTTTAVAGATQFTTVSAVYTANGAALGAQNVTVRASGGGATQFTTVSAVYTANGAALGAQNVTVRASGGGAGVCTLAGATSELGADVPAQTQEAYCNKLTLGGPNGDSTFVTIVGTNSADAAARERCQLDGASPSKVTSTTVWRYIDRICLGELTNAGAGSVKSDATVDTAAMKCGVVIVAAAVRGDDATALVKPNA